MLIHITPRFYIPPSVPFAIEACEMVSLCIDEIGVSLTAADTVTRQPYPNKRYWVGASRGGRKAMQGMLFETPAHIEVFNVIARWAINGDRVVVHHTEYTVLDSEFDAVSDMMVLWYATGIGGVHYDRRWPASVDGTPAEVQPRMELFTDLPGGEQPNSNIYDSVAPNGLIVRRTEKFSMHTLQRERVIQTKLTDRMPSIATAIQCGELAAA